VNPGSVADDNDPGFVSEFYKNLRLLSQDLYKRTATVGILPGQGNESSSSEIRTNSLEKKGSTGTLKQLVVDEGNMISSNSVNSSASLTTGTASATPLLKKKSSMGTLPVGSIGTASSSSVTDVESADYFSQEKFQERMKMYIKEVGIDVDYISRYSVDMKSKKSAARDTNADI
jgi:hypothetical protein